MGPDTYILECSVCGPLGGVSEADTHETARSHLYDFHNVEDITWRPGPSPS